MIWSFYNRDRYGIILKQSFKVALIVYDTDLYTGSIFLCIILYHSLYLFFQWNVNYHSWKQWMFIIWSYSLFAITYGNGGHFNCSIKIQGLWYLYDGLREYHYVESGLKKTTETTANARI